MDWPDNVLISAMERYALKGARAVLWGRRDKSRTPTHLKNQIRQIEKLLELS